LKIKIIELNQPKTNRIMETTNVESQDIANHHYSYVANLILNENKSAFEATTRLVDLGLSAEIAG
jgi:hypothetical protein